MQIKRADPIGFGPLLFGSGGVNGTYRIRVELLPGVKADVPRTRPKRRLWVTSRHLWRSAQNEFLRALSFFSPAALRELYWQFLTGFFCATETLNYDLCYYSDEATELSSISLSTFLACSRASLISACVRQTRFRKLEPVSRS